MQRKRAYISFDYDHDNNLKTLLVGQARNPDSPFEIVDMSIKEVISEGWKNNARRRIRSCDVVIVICGKFTNLASGVSAEVQIAQEENVPYFLLAGYPDGQNVKPIAAYPSDKVYGWTWKNLHLLIGGCR